MRVFWKNHRLALILALVVGLIAVAPTILAPLALGSGYHSIQYLPLDDENVYRSQIHEVLDGYWNIASPFLYEYKSSAPPAAIPPINLWLYALPAMLFGLSAIVVASKFLLPALLFFFVYLLTLDIIGQSDRPAWLAAITAGLLVALGTEFVNYEYLIPALRGLIPPDPLPWTRLVNPPVGAVEIFVFLWLLIRAERNRWYLFLAGIVLALTVGYFFSFGLSLMVLGMLGVFALCTKDYRKLGALLSVLGISLVLDSWYWYKTLTTFGGAAGRAAAMRNGMFFTHAPVFNKELALVTIIVLASFAYVWFIQKRRDHANAWIWSGSLIAGAWLALNQQIITGREIWVPHFSQYTVPVSLVALIVALFVALRAAPRTWAALMYVLCALCLAYGAFSLTSYVPRLNAYAAEQNDAALLSWLGANAPKECVVLVKDEARLEELNWLVTAYTGCDVYTSAFTYYGIPQDRVLYNYLLQMRLAGVTTLSMNSYLLANAGSIRDNFFDDWNELEGTGVDPWVLGKIAIVEAAYPTFLAGNFESEIQQYRMDYMVTDAPLSSALAKQLPGLHLVATPGPYFLYSF